MRWAFAGSVDEPSARAILRRLIEEEDEDALRLDGRAIEVDDMVPLRDPRRHGILYLCIGCGGAVQRMCPHGWWRVCHSNPHNCSFLGDGS